MRTGLLCAALALLLLAGLPARAAEPLRAVGDCRDQERPDAATLALCTAVLDRRALSPRERAAAYRIRGRSRLATGDTGGGAADLERSIALDPDDPLAWLLRAGARQVAGDLPGAYEDASRSLRLRPDDPAALLARAGILLRQRRLDRAYDDASRAIALAPATAAYMMRAEICLAGPGVQRGTPPPCDLAAALADAQQAVAAATDNYIQADALVVEGRIRDALGQPAAAIAAYEAGIDADEACTDCLAGEQRIKDRAKQGGQGGGQPIAPPAARPAPQARPDVAALIARINDESGRAVFSSGGKLLVTTGLRPAGDGRLEILFHACPGLTMKSPPAKIEACRAASPQAPTAALSFAPADIDSRTVRMEAGGRTVRVQFHCKADQPCVARGDGEAAVAEAWMTCPGLTACNNLALDLATLLDALALATP